MDLSLIPKYFILFMMYSCAGWIMESICVALYTKKLTNRGFLIGPYCPIYGFGALLIILFLNKFSFNPLVLFIVTTIVCGILEYFTSWAMEKIFKARWWDYSNKKIQLNGRICLSNLIAFGAMGLLVTYYLNPIFETWISNLNYEYMQGLALILWTIFLIDLVLSTLVVYGFRKVTEKINEERTADNTEQITKMVRERLSKKSALHRRFLDAYPKLEAIKLKVQEIKTKIGDVTSDAKDVVVEKVNNVKEAVTEKKEVIRTNIEQGTKKAKMNINAGKERIVNTLKKQEDRKD